MSRVTVDLPFVPEIETIGTRRSASRIQAGGGAAGALDALGPARQVPFLGPGQARGP